MLTKRDVANELNEKYVKWSKQTFNLVKLPDDIIRTFEEAVFLVPPDKHLLLPNDIRAILSKSPVDLSIVEVGHIANVILAAAPYQLYKDMDEYLTKGAFYPNLKISFNKMDADKKAALQREAESKLRLIK